MTNTGESPLEEQFRRDTEAIEKQWQEVGKPLWDGLHQMIGQMFPDNTGEGEERP